MAVLVEAHSLLVRKDAIEAHVEGGLPRFLSLLPPLTFCMDDGLVQIGFMDGESCARFVHELQHLGLTHREDGRARDMAVCDADGGLLHECDWIEVGPFPIGAGRKVQAAWLFEGPRLRAGMHLHRDSMKLRVPDGWVFEGSLSEPARAA
jgi:hypothetical protein